MVNVRFFHCQLSGDAADADAGGSGGSSSERSAGVLEDSMSVGMLVGFSVFLLLGVAACCAWHVLCNKLCHPKVKVAPSDFRNIGH